MVLGEQLRKTLNAIRVQHNHEEIFILRYFPSQTIEAGLTGTEIADGLISHEKSSMFRYPYSCDFYSFSSCSAADDRYQELNRDH